MVFYCLPSHVKTWTCLQSITYNQPLLVNFCSSGVKEAIERWARDVVGTTEVLDPSGEPRVRVNEKKTRIVMTVTDKNGKPQVIDSKLSKIMDRYGR